MITGWRCAVCLTELDVSAHFPWRCPRATTSDRHHVLHPVDDGADRGDGALDPDRSGDPNPFVRFGPRLAWWAYARANGMTIADCDALTREVADGFTITPSGPSSVLADALGLDVWVKDETGNVAGSHKARHLVTILLHLRAAEELGLLVSRPPLAIASCGNAALAAATLARSANWPIRVFVPDWMDDAFGRALDSLGAEIHRCPRNDTDPVGDPAMHRFREAVDAGCVPFSVQGPENALCLDGGRTLGWEMVEDRPDRIFVQVGGGAFAGCVGAALGPATRLHAVQAAGCAPLAAAWERAASFPDPQRRWSEVMVPWADPRSAADGILDDETYDWIAVVDAMRASGGWPVVADEEQIVAAHQLARAAGFDASVTGSAGLAGLVVARDDVADGERVAIVMSGVAR